MTNNNNHIIRDLRRMLPRRPLDMREVRAVAEAQAIELLRSLGITRPPIDVGMLSQLPRVRVEVVAELQNRQLSGESGWHGGRWIIRVSKRDSLTRRRFTLAHEFKHVLDGPSEKRAYAKLGLGDEDDRQACIEEIADYFAASLLMPRLFVARALRTDVRDVHRLAALFMVSPTAMNRRLRELGLRIDPPAEGRDPVMRFFRKAAVCVPHRGRRPDDGGEDDEMADNADATRQQLDDLPGAIGFKKTDADQPCGPASALLTISEASAMLRISRWSVYRLINARQLESIKIGARRLVPYKAIHAFIDQQVAEEMA